MSYCNCWDYLLLHEDWGVLRTGRERAGGGGGGLEVEFLTGICFFSLRNVPGVLKKIFFFGGGGEKFLSFFSLLKLFFGGGGGFWGVWGAPRPTRGSRGVGKRHTSSYGHDM